MRGFVLAKNLFFYFLKRRFLCAAFFLVFFSACQNEANNPYPASERSQNTLYSAFSERPKHLDPAQSLEESEATFLYQIYEMPLQYHYLKRPYELIPQALEEMPLITYFDQNGQKVAGDHPKIAFSKYTLKIKKGVLYQPHPAFAKDEKGAFIYENLTEDQLKNIETIADFKKTGTRELEAKDYAYQIKRLAHPHLHSPAFSTLAAHIEGLNPLAETLQKASQQLPKEAWLDLDLFPLNDVQVIDKHTLTIRIKGKYPQFSYWLAMSFFAPVPREADRFYSQAGMADKNLTLDWYPVGTGAYMLTENNPNKRMVLTKNPNFHGEFYPCEGEESDKAAGFLNDCGQKLPQIDKVVFSLEKENIPYWNKFLQGYYDASGISSDSFDKAVNMSGGSASLSDEMRAQGISLLTNVRASTFYMGFNMDDLVLGAKSAEAKYLRQALSIAIDQEEFIAIFLNGRGIPAMNPLPTGFFGRADENTTKEGINPFVYDWIDGKAQRKSIQEAKKLLAKAGFPNGRNAKTGAPLVLNLDTTIGGAGDKAQLDWLTRQFAKLDIQLVIRSTDANRFYEKIAKGATQIFFLGWNADYPDSENFFFLLEGAQAKNKSGGENSTNYQNPRFDALFAQMKTMENTEERAKIIREMIHLVQEDAPWIFGFHSKSYSLAHEWVKNRKPAAFGNNGVKYQRLDVNLREAKRRQWNQAHWSPVLLFLGLLALVILAIVSAQKLKQRKK